MPEPELQADLTQNHDEVLDLEMGMAALGGLRHSAACDASQRSNRRYDDLNHRLYESRMSEMFGLPAKSDEGEAEDMSQQVMIRSPIIHNHRYDAPKAADAPEPTPTQPATPSNGLLNAAIIGLSTLTGLGGAGYLISNAITPSDTKPPVVVPGDQTDYGVKSSIKPGFGVPKKISTPSAK